MTLPLALAVLVVPLADLLLIGLLRWDYLLTPYRISLALFTSIAITELTRGRDNTLRSALAPIPSWAYWGWVILILGTVLLTVCVVAYGALRLCGVGLAVPTLAPQDIPEALYRMCVDAPLVEEVIYRQALCGGVVALAGPRWAIVTSGILFAELHWIYGNPSPENQVGGFLLAWAYLRSGTLAVPILFHAVGNLAALLVQMAAYHVIGA